MPQGGHNEDLRQLEHLAPLGFAFLLPSLTWTLALVGASAALGYAVFVAPRIGATRRPHEQAGRCAGGKVAYAAAILGMILLFPAQMYVTAAVWANLAVGDAVSNVVGRRFGSAHLPWNAEKSWLGSTAGMLASAAAGFGLLLWTQVPAAPEARGETALLYASATALACAVAESLPLPVDDNITICVAGAAFLAWLSRAESLAQSRPDGLIWALVVPALLGLAAYAFKTLTAGAALAGAVLAAVVAHAFGPSGLALLGAFFVVGSGASRFGYERKAALGIAEGNQGRRSLRHVVGKGVAAALAAAAGCFVETRQPAQLAFTAAMGAAVYDTTATELGQLWGRRPVLLTSWQRVPRGTPGGVSLAGSLAGCAAALLIVGLAAALDLVGRYGALWALGAATASVHLEAFLAARSVAFGRAVAGEWMNALHTTVAMLVALVLSRLEW